MNAHWLKAQVRLHNRIRYSFAFTFRLSVRCGNAVRWPRRSAPHAQIRVRRTPSGRGERLGLMSDTSGLTGRAKAPSRANLKPLPGKPSQVYHLSVTVVSALGPGFAKLAELPVRA